MEAYEFILDVPQWQLQSKLEEFSRLLERTQQWAQQSEVKNELAGVEVPVYVEVAPDIRVGGFMDRLMQDGDGNYLVVDLKTGKSAATQAEAEENRQLMTYQLALSRGSFDGQRVRDGEGMPRAGGVLVYPGKDSSKITTRTQSQLTAEALEEFSALLPPLAAELRGPQLTARTNKDCDKCPIRTICPVQEEGKMTIHA